MKYLLFFLVFLSSFSSLYAKPLKVAIIDTGLKKEFYNQAHLCPDQNKDFTNEGLEDINDHGTNIAGTIIENAGNADYCLVIIKVYKADSPFENVTNLVKGLKYALEIDADIVNYSGGGEQPFEIERKTILSLLNKNVMVIVAAGNERLNLDQNCRFYPACYDKRILVISNNRPYANKGSVVDSYENGTSIGFGITMSGTSQSTAIFTGKLIKKLAGLKGTK